MKDFIIKKLVPLRNYLIYKKYDVFARLTNKSLPRDPEAKFVVSIASYPKRDPLLPAVFQALSKQTVAPQKWILVLSVEDYPNGLPNHLTKLEKEGVEILWVKDNPYAVKKLIPVVEKYPDFAVVTLDDDIIYHHSLLMGLVEGSRRYRASIIGYYGKALFSKNATLDMYYRELKPANELTNSLQVYLIGWAGIYYPPKSLDERMLAMEAVHDIVPGRGSDFWFWAAAHAKGTRQMCLGLPESFKLGIPIPLNSSTRPKDRPGNEVIQRRFQKTVDYFGIRNKLLKTLPNNKN